MYDQKAAFRAQFGTPEMQDKEMHHSDHMVRKAVAQYGDDHHRDWLLHDKHPHVQQRLALHTTKKEHLDHLIKSTNPYTRVNVARNGGPEHHAILMHDKESDVRAAVAETTSNPDHHSWLSQDISTLVKGQLAHNPHVSDKVLEHLKVDDSKYVRNHAHDAWNNRHDPDGWHADEDHGANH